MRTLKFLLSHAMWIVPLFVIVWMVIHVRSLPPSTPSEIVSQSLFMILLFIGPAIYFFWRIVRRKSALDMPTIWNCIRAVAFTHIGVLWLFSALYGWWEDGQGGIVLMTVADTFFKGVFFDLLGSFQIRFSQFEPETHLLVWRSISWFFGMLYTLIIPAIGIVIYKEWMQPTGD